LEKKSPKTKILVNNQSFSMVAMYKAIHTTNGNYTFIIVITHLSCKTQKTMKQKYNHEQCSDATFKISNLKIQSEENHSPKTKILVRSQSANVREAANTTDIRLVISQRTN